MEIESGACHKIGKKWRARRPYCYNNKTAFILHLQTRPWNSFDVLLTFPGALDDFIKIFRNQTGSANREKVGIESERGIRGIPQKFIRFCFCPGWWIIMVSILKLSPCCKLNCTLRDVEEKFAHTAFRMLKWLISADCHLFNWWQSKGETNWYLAMHVAGCSAKLLR